MLKVFFAGDIGSYGGIGETSAFRPLPKAFPASVVIHLPCRWNVTGSRVFTVEPFHGGLDVLVAVTVLFRRGKDVLAVYLNGNGVVCVAV